MLSNLKRITLKCSKFRLLIDSYRAPKSINIFRSSATLKDIYKPFSISRTFQRNPETLRVEFRDSLTADFHYIWLRDNCTCNKCVHPNTKQKLIDTLSLDLKIAPRFCNVTNTGKLKIVWPQGHGEHFSYYDPAMLHLYALGFEKNLYESMHDCLPPVETWNGESLRENLLQLEYEEIMQSQRGIMLSIESIYKLGILIVKNVPCEPGEIMKVMNRITNIKNTRLGASFRITSDDSFFKFPDANTNVEFYTDMAYLEKSPGIQAFHCLDETYKDLAGSVDEIASVMYFVDGFFVANLIKEQYPMYFEVLSSIPAKFRLFTQDMYYFSYQPILKLNSSRIVTEVHFNNKAMAPLEGPSSSIYDFYAAYQMFGEMIRKSENHFMISLKRGDMVIMNNRRVLHGRELFDMKRMTKHFEVCYADLDEVLARYRSFLLKR